MGLSDTLKAVADPIRRDILEILKKERHSAGEIAKQFNLSQATISYHLTQLKKAGLISETKYKNFIYYELNVSIFEDLLVWIYDIKKENNIEK